jgi:putative FmdB family regulatory protein
MPIYTYHCDNKHRFETYLPVSRYDEPQTCECGASSKRIITAPMVFVKPDIRYTSPVDGRPITSRAQRRDDLARNNCIEYDPEVKKDFHRRIEREDREFDKAVDETVEREVAHMPARKREKLEAELAGGFDVQPVRLNAPLAPIKTEITHG